MPGLPADGGHRIETVCDRIAVAHYFNALNKSTGGGSGLPNVLGHRCEPRPAIVDQLQSEGKPHTRQPELRNALKTSVLRLARDLINANKASYRIINV